MHLLNWCLQARNHVIHTGRNKNDLVRWTYTDETVDIRQISRYQQPQIKIQTPIIPDLLHTRRKKFTSKSRVPITRNYQSTRCSVVWWRYSAQICKCKFWKLSSIHWRQYRQTKLRRVVCIDFENIKVGLVHSDVIEHDEYWVCVKIVIMSWWKNILPIQIYSPVCIWNCSSELALLVVGFPTTWAFVLFVIDSC